MRDLAPPSPTPSRPLIGLRDVADAFDLIVCDVWGVVHDGRAHTPSAVDALTRFRARGGRVVLLTNAPRPHGAVIAQLDTLGVPRASYDAVVSSGDVTVDLMAARGARRVFHLGPPRDGDVFHEAGRRLGRPVLRVGVETAEEVVCTGLFRDDDALEPYETLLVAMRQRDLTMICANPDRVVHSGDHLLWCAGALADRYAALGGVVKQAGKPYPAIYDAALRRAQTWGARPSSDRILAIGDGLFTDMAGAAAQGWRGLFISGGVHRAAIHPAAGFDAAAYERLAREANAAPFAHLRRLTW